MNNICIPNPAQADSDNRLRTLFRHCSHACMVVQVGPPPPWLGDRKPDEWKPKDVANAVLTDRLDKSVLTACDNQAYMSMKYRLVH